MAALLENLWVKIAAIILAILLWFHVATEKIYQHEITLPLEKIDITGDLVLVDPPPDSVRIAVSATGKRLLRTDWKKRGLKLTVTRSYPGKFKVDLDKNNTNLIKAEKVSLVDIVNPLEITLNCDRKVQKEVPVRVRVSVDPAEGFTVKSKDSLLPEMVTLTGPQKTLADIQYVYTEEKSIEGIRKDIVRKIPLAPSDEYGVVYQPDSVYLYMTVVPVKRKIFSKIDVELINAPEDTIFNLKPSRIEIRVIGEAAAIDSLRPSDISAIADYMLRDSDGKAPIEPIFPASVSLLHQSFDSVRITQKR